MVCIYALEFEFKFKFFGAGEALVYRRAGGAVTRSKTGLDRTSFLILVYIYLYLVYIYILYIYIVYVGDNMNLLYIFKAIIDVHSSSFQHLFYLHKSNFSEKTLLNLILPYG